MTSRHKETYKNLRRLDESNHHNFMAFSTKLHPNWRPTRLPSRSLDPVNCGRDRCTSCRRARIPQADIVWICAGNIFFKKVFWFKSNFDQGSMKGEGQILEYKVRHPMRDFAPVRHFCALRVGAPPVTPSNFALHAQIASSSPFLQELMVLSFP